MSGQQSGAKDRVVHAAWSESPAAQPEAGGAPKPRLPTASYWGRSASRVVPIAWTQAWGSTSKSRILSEAPKLHHTQGRIQVTKKGRVKMVHDETSRTEDWLSVPLKEYSATQKAGKCITLQALELEAGDFRINILNDGEPKFQLDPESLTVVSLSPGLASTSALDVGDCVVAVDEVAVDHYETYLEMTGGKPAYTLTFRPAELLRPPTAKNFDAAAGMRFSRIEFNITNVAGLEDTGTIRVPLRRLGDIKDRAEWPWGVKNSNVNPRIFDEIPEQYLEGTAVFEPGADSTTIEVAVPADPSWTVESLYFVFLEHDGLREQHGAHVMLGHNATVNIYSLNMDSFPDGAFGKLDNLKDEHDIPWQFLAWKFFVHNYHEIRSETRWGIFYALLPNLFYYFTQLNFGVLVNCAIADKEKAQCTMGGVDFSPLVFNENLNSAALVLLVIAIVRLLILVMEHVVDMRARFLKLGGKTTLKLRANMYTTMLQMSDGAASKFDNGDIQKILDTEVESAVQNVWLLSFALLRQLGAVSIKLLLSIQIVSGVDAVSVMIILLACIPSMAIVSLVIFNCRKRKLLVLHDRAFTCDENWSAFVTLSTEAMSLIRSYHRVWHFRTTFQEIHSSYNAAAFKASDFSKQTIWLLRYSFFLFSGVVIVMGGSEVRRGKLKPGDFLVLLRVIDGFGGDVLSAAKILNKMLFGSAAVRKVSEVLNAETWRHELRSLRPLSSELEQSTDDHAIRMSKVHFMYPGMQEGQNYALAPLDLNLPAGKLICFPGRSSFVSGEEEDMPGINTLFSIISGRLLPRAGEVLVPARWRVIYVPVVPVLFDGTLMYNLLFSDCATSRDLAWDICEGLGMSPGLIGKDDFDVGSNGHFLRFSDRVVVSIARALLHDVDVLLISSVLDVLGQGPAVKVMRFLRTYTENRGFARDETPAYLRHMKTVMYTSKFKLIQEQASYLVHPMLPESCGASPLAGVRSLRLSASASPLSPVDRAVPSVEC